MVISNRYTSNIKIYIVHSNRCKRIDIINYKCFEQVGPAQWKKLIDHVQRELKKSVGVMMAYKKKLLMIFFLAGGPDDSIYIIQ